MTGREFKTFVGAVLGAVDDGCGGRPFECFGVVGLDLGR